MQATTPVEDQDVWVGSIDHCMAGRTNCSRPVVGVAVGACPNGHFREGTICAHHLTKRLTCRVCDDAGVCSHLNVALI